MTKKMLNICKKKRQKNNRRNVDIGAKQEGENTGKRRYIKTNKKENCKK